MQCRLHRPDGRNVCQTIRDRLAVPLAGRWTTLRTWHQLKVSLNRRLAPAGCTLISQRLDLHRIYQHDPLFLSRPLDAPMHTFSSPASLLSSSFYVRLSMSPDGRYLACGSSGLGYGTSIFDTTTTASRRVFGETREASAVLHGHRQEVGSLDWANGAVSFRFGYVAPLRVVWLGRTLILSRLRYSSRRAEMTCPSGSGGRTHMLRSVHSLQRTRTSGGTTAERGAGRPRRPSAPRRARWSAIEPRLVSDSIRI